MLENLPFETRFRSTMEDLGRNKLLFPDIFQFNRIFFFSKAYVRFWYDPPTSVLKKYALGVPTPVQAYLDTQF